MTLEALVSNELPNFLIYDTISAAAPASLLFDNTGAAADSMGLLNFFSGGGASAETSGEFAAPALGDVKPGQGRRKRRRRPRSCKNNEEAENQRMTHIAVERNRRRQMNEHLAVLRSLMPESYVQRGDQASVVGGAIDFVKELEQLLQSLESQKRTLQHQQQEQQQRQKKIKCEEDSTETEYTEFPPFAQFFAYPQYSWYHAPRDYPPALGSHRVPAVADIEVTLVETHANLRILSARRPRQLLKLAAGLQTLGLSILHLNVTSLDSMVLYSVSTKVEEGCSLTTVDDIAAAVHHMLSLIEAEAAALAQQN